MTAANARGPKWWRHPVLWWQRHVAEMKAVQQLRDSGELRPFTFTISTDPALGGMVNISPVSTGAMSDGSPPYTTQPQVAAKPRRKGLGPKQLAWLRKNCVPFRDMEARSKASRLVAAKAQGGRK